MSEFKLPKTLAGCADLLYTTRQKRLDVQKQADDLEGQEKLLKAHLIDSLPKSDALGVSGKVAHVLIVTKQEPQVKDWDVFYAHIKKKGAFHLMNRALNKASVREQMEAGKVVPGVEMFTAVTVSLKKI